MDQNEAVIGSIVIASDEYWGTYLGELEGVFKSYTNYRARVKIIKTLAMPRQDAILFKDKQCLRKPYTSGKIESFNLANVSTYMGLTENTG